MIDERAKTFLSCLGNGAGSVDRAYELDTPNDELECENHELNCIDESWISDTEVRVTFKCSLCKKKFDGVVKER